jgi:hypothetical protein
MQIKTSLLFDRQLKRILKKHKSFIKEIEKLETSLLENPYQGESLGDGAYKIRLPIPSKNKGKSAGARVISLLRIPILNTIYLLEVYDKSEYEDIADKDLKAHIKAIDNLK